MDTVRRFKESISFPHFKREHNLPFIAAATTVLLYASYKLISKTESTNTKGKEIPVPGSAYPYVGHMFSLTKLPFKQVSKWHKELGPIIKLHMGVQTWIMVDEPELVHKIFVTHGAETSYRPQSLFTYDYYSNKGKGLTFGQPDSTWKDVRAAALSVLAPKHIEKYMDQIRQESKDLVSGLLESTEKKKDGTNPIKFLELYSMNNIFSILFSKKYKSVQDPEYIVASGFVESSVKLLDAKNDLANFIPVASIFEYFAGTRAKMKKFIENVRDPLFETLIQEATKSSKPNLIKSLEEEKFNLSEEDRLILTVDLVNGGTNTVAVTLSWIIALMCHHQEVQASAFNEIDHFIKFHDRLPRFDERTQFPYCISVIKECMRYRPTTIFGIPHKVNEDIEVDGYIIPKGSTLVSNMHSIHKQAAAYPEPERFIPGRFISNLKTMHAAANGKLEERDHYNFGWGRRICPAIYLAEVELFFAFVEIISRCIIEPISDDVLPDIEGGIDAYITAMPLPYKVKFTRRRTDSIV